MLIENKPIPDRPNKIPSPLITILTVWIVSIAVQISGLIHYEEIPWVSWGVIYLIGALFLYVLGFVLGERLKMSLRVTRYKRIPQQNTMANDLLVFGRLISIFAWCGIIASLLFAFEMLFIVGVNPQDIMGTRELFIFREASMFSQIAVVLGAGGYFSLVSVVYYWNILSPGRRFLWLLSPCLITLFSVLSAGRQTIFQLVLIGFFTLLFRQEYNIIRARSMNMKLSILGGLLILVFSYGMVVAFQRNPLPMSLTKKDLLTNLSNTTFNPQVDVLLDKSPPVIRDGVAEMTLYYTQEIPYFMVFWELPRPGPYWGLWEFPFIARRLYQFHFVPITVDERMQIVYDLFAVSGRFSQVWQTSIRDLMIDFGDYGALFVMLLFGYVSGRIYRRIKIEGGLIMVYLLIGILLLCVYSVILSLVSDTLFFFYMLVSIILYIRFHSGGRLVKRDIVSGDLLTVDQTIK